MVYSTSVSGTGFPLAGSCLVDGVTCDRDESNGMVGAARDGILAFCQCRVSL